MKKNAFTLVELLGVITILGLLMIIAIPSIVNQIKKTEGTISDATKNLIYNATQIYFEKNANEYQYNSGNVYCVSLQTLVDNKELDSNMLDINTGRKIDFTKIVKATIENRANVEYEIVNSGSCTEIVMEVPNKPVLTEGMIPVKYNGTNWVTTDSSDKNWYNYNNKEWANIVTLDTSKLFDHSGNKYTGTINGAVSNNEGMFFDGVDDYIELDSSLKNYDFGNQITMTIRFKMNQLSNQNCLLGNWQSGGGGIYLLDDYIVADLHINGAYVILNSNIIPELNKFYTVTLTYDGSAIKLYINGNLSKTESVVGTIKSSPVSFGIGNNLNTTVHDSYSNAVISHVAVYKNALSASQVKDNFSVVPKFIKNNLLFAYDLRTIKDFENGTVVDFDNINTMWVWIPRYAYKITSGFHSSEAGTIDIKFLIGNSNRPSNRKTPIESSGYEVGIKDTSMHYFKHPAFTFGDDEIEGFWVAKFEPSGSAADINIVPNVSSLRSMTIGDQFDAAMNMKNNNKYGWNTSSVDTHMMKNSEWGAVAYLAQSIFGATDEVWINNSSTFTTGCAGNSTSAASYNGCQNVYTTVNGQKASTTHNITGVYDMSGSAWEQVVVYVDNNHENLNIYGGSIMVANNKYKDIYLVTIDDKESNYNNTSLYYGDAIYETSSSYTGDTSWHNDSSSMATFTNCFLGRDGTFDRQTRTGLFHFGPITGAANINATFRPVVVAK